jgi:ketosteroid isomerase-like protein
MGNSDGVRKDVRLTEENVKVMRRCYGFWTNGDFSAIPEVVDPDLGVYRGLDGLRRFIEQLDEVWERFQIEPEEFIGAGDNVVVAVRVSGKGRGKGVEPEVRLFSIWTLREGKVVRVTGGYRDRTEALEAAGLRE